MFDYCIISIDWLTLLVYYFTHLVMLLASYGMLIMFILTPIILSLLYIPFVFVRLLLYLIIIIAC